jgi:hypothetical protein
VGFLFGLLGGIGGWLNDGLVYAEYH